MSCGAGFWIRAGARLIDTLCGVCLGFVVGIFAGIALVLLEHAGMIAPGWQYGIKGFNPIGVLLGLVGNVLYHSLTEGMFGASLGKLILQLRVVDENGGPITIPKAILRNLGYFIDALFFGYVAYSSMKDSDLNQRFGDKWAHTVVARVGDIPATSNKGGEIFVLSFLMGSACWMFCTTLGIVLRVL
jgi:uncharacterized RDD family membrane protein YckC